MLERFLNGMADMDWGWWPFLYLRPPKTVPTDTRRTLIMALHFGPMLSAVLAILRALRGHFSVVEVVLSLPFTMALFFLIYRFSFAIAWNRRAERLAAKTTGAEMPSAWGGD
jgi:uncharacterized membrane protein